MLAQGDTFLEPSWPKMSPRIDFSTISDLFWGSKMHQKSIQKPNNFQTSLETLFSANRVHKNSKMRVQNHSKLELFLGRIKNRESYSRLHADLVFEVQSTPKSHVFRTIFVNSLHVALEPFFFRFLSKMQVQMAPQNG